ncbi:MAG TPA: hypothetical protein VF484_08320 [Candidatus Limnocylindrales bacterium]
MTRLPRGAALMAVLVAGCSLVSPQPPDPQRGLNLENRGGPVYVVRIAGSDVVEVPCDSSKILTPGQPGVPQLPWSISIVRKRDGAVLFAGDVGALPRWFIEIGDTPLGLGDTPVAGPAGPTCPAD